MILSLESEAAATLFESMLDQIPHGYTVALLREGQELPAGSVVEPGVDVEYLGWTHVGIVYHDLNEEGDPVYPLTTKVRPWQEVDRVHVY